MKTSLIDQGLNLMLYGMGTVFVFLTLLVFATSLMSRLVARFASEEDAGSGQPAAESAATGSTLPRPQILQAIRLAIAEHRKN